MNTMTKNIVGAGLAAVLSFGLISFSCSGKGAASNGANTAFADTVPAVKIPAESLSVLEAMQNDNWREPYGMILLFLL